MRQLGLHQGALRAELCRHHSRLQSISVRLAETDGRLCAREGLVQGVQRNPLDVVQFPLVLGVCSLCFKYLLLYTNIF
jgi:hypothetical protein